VGVISGRLSKFGTAQRVSRTAQRFSEQLGNFPVQISVFPDNSALSPSGSALSDASSAFFYGQLSVFSGQFSVFWSQLSICCCHLNAFFRSAQHIPRPARQILQTAIKKKSGQLCDLYIHRSNLSVQIAKFHGHETSLLFPLQNAVRKPNFTK
jgi:hypothetical protein